MCRTRRLHRQKLRHTHEMPPPPHPLLADPLGDDLLGQAEDERCHEDQPRRRSAANRTFNVHPSGPYPRGTRFAQLCDWAAGEEGRDYETSGRPAANAGGVARHGQRHTVRTSGR